MKPALVLAAAAAVCGSPVLAQIKPEHPHNSYTLQWRDLGRIVSGRRVALTLPSGIRLKGDVAAVEPDRIILFVTGSSDRRAYPKGRAVIPRPEVTSLRLVKVSGYTWRVGGTAIGAGLGSMVAVPMALYGSRPLPVAAAVALPAVLGFLLGSAADRQTVAITIAPGPD